MASKVCFISASPESTAIYTEVLASLPESPPIFGGDIQGALAAALDAVRKGYDILVTQDHTERRLWGKVDTPIVSFTITPFDIARAVYQAREEYGDPIAFFESHDPYILSPMTRKILPANFTEFVYNGRQDGIAKLRQAVREGFRAVVGGAVITAHGTRGRRPLRHPSPLAGGHLEDVPAGAADCLGPNRSSNARR